MTTGFVVFLLVLVVVWLSILTFYFWKLRAHYYYLTEGVNKKTLPQVLEQLAKEQHVTKKDIAILLSRCATIEKKELLHIQKIGLLRFNPFKDTGGDQSFILALIDANDTGVVISGLYSRSGTRWYAKRVIQGKGQDHELSGEEVKALKLARES